MRETFIGFLRLRLLAMIPLLIILVVVLVIAALR
jgi:hypothetical protein